MYGALRALEVCMIVTTLCYELGMVMYKPMYISRGGCFRELDCNLTSNKASEEEIEVGTRERQAINFFPVKG